MEHNGRPLSPQNVPVEAAEPSELMQLEMSEDIKLGSPEDGSNNLNSDFHLLAVSQPRSPGELPRQLDSSCRAESTPRWPLQPDPSCSGLPVLPSGTKMSKSDYVVLLHKKLSLKNRVHNIKRVVIIQIKF